MTARGPVAAAVVAALLSSSVALRPAAASTASGSHGAVATDQMLASRVGLDVLRHGGNAVDAAVAIGYALAVTYPSAGNVGGGGFMLVWDARSATTHFIDFRERAPAAATANMYLDAAGRVVPDRSTVGALAVAIPGTVAGLELARERFGTRSRHDLIAPAIALARNGFVLSGADVASFAEEATLLGKFPVTAAAFLPGGRPPRAGSVLRQPELAATLQAIAERGPAGFYAGPVARRLIAAIAAGGGIATLADLAGFRAVERDPIACAEGTHRIETSPPPSSGGVAICETLGILAHLPHAPYRSAAAVHDEVEAERLAFADRSSALGDPDFGVSPVARLLAPEHLARDATRIAPDRATPSSEVRGLGLHEGVNTTNYAVVDAAGDAVDVTYTLNSTFGSGLVAAGTGVLLNDEMDDFTSAPGVPNQFGLVQGAVNAIAPNKRPLSSMSPTIALDARGGVALVGGAAGGPRIITTTLDLVRDAFEFDLPIGTAINAPRVHEQWLPDVLFAQPGSFPAAVGTALVAMGYRIEYGPADSDANAICIDSRGLRTAAHDDRRPEGAALAY